MSEKTGIEKLRSLPRYVYSTIETANGRVIDKRFAVTVTEDEAIAIADQIERERMEELNVYREQEAKLLHRIERLEAKRDLTSEAREVVRRLRDLDADRPQDLYYVIFGEQQPNGMKHVEANGKIAARLIELIEHGGKQDVDVAELLELADDLESLEVTTSSADLASGYEQGCEYAAELLRKAVEGATVPDAESDAERACAALLDWRDQVAGLLGIDAVSMADEVQDAIMAELDKRLMPPGMAWPRWDDGKQVSHYDTLEDATAICLALDGSCYSLHYDMPDGERVCLFDGSERVKRPEPEVLGADGEPIRKGETVYDGTGNRHIVVEVDTDRALVEFDGELKRGWCASFITHTPPDTQERIDDDASMPPRRYYAAKIGHDVGLKDDEEVFTAVALDLLRRQRELDAKTMGGE